MPSYSAMVATDCSSDDAPPAPRCRPPMRPWRCGCGRGRWTSWSGRSTSWARARRCARRSRGASAQRDPLRAAGGGEDDAGADRRGGRRGRLRGGVGGQRRQGRDQGGDRAGARAAPGQRAADGPLPRRDPPLQQGPAGRPAAGGRGGAADADRGDHREPLLRGQLGAALALPDLRAAPAGARAGRGAAAARAEPTPSAASPTRRRSRTPRWRCWPHRSGGDARVALSALERAVERAARRARSTSPPIEDALQRKAVDYDRQGDRHYDFISAWIKATRGSDVDASLYYLAVMLEGGEDPRFIARRMVILASEDVGNADPQALLVADAAARAVDRVGLPECALNLAQASVYLALAPKSNASYKAPRRRPRRGPRQRRQDAARLPARRPLPRRRAKLGRGEGYRYAHDEPGGVGDQQLLPPRARGRRFYAPTDRGFEAELGRRLGGAAEEIRGKLSRGATSPKRRCFNGRLSKLEPGRADTPAGGLDWGPPAGTIQGESGGTRQLRLATAAQLPGVQSLRWGRPPVSPIYASAAWAASERPATTRMTAITRRSDASSRRPVSRAPR